MPLLRQQGANINHWNLRFLQVGLLIVIGVGATQRGEWSEVCVQESLSIPSGAAIIVIGVGATQCADISEVWLTGCVLKPLPNGPCIWLNAVVATTRGVYSCMPLLRQQGANINHCNLGFFASILAECFLQLVSFSIGPILWLALEPHNEPNYVKSGCTMVLALCLLKPAIFPCSCK